MCARPSIWVQTLSLMNRAEECLARLLTDFCDARDANRGTAWERLSVAYPDPHEARRAVELFQRARPQLTTAAA